MSKLFFWLGDFFSPRRRRRSRRVLEGIALSMPGVWVWRTRDAARRSRKRRSASLQGSVGTVSRWREMGFGGCVVGFWLCEWGLRSCSAGFRWWESDFRFRQAGFRCGEGDFRSGVNGLRCRENGSRSCSADFRCWETWGFRWRETGFRWREMVDKLLEIRELRRFFKSSSRRDAATSTRDECATRMWRNCPLGTADATRLR